ncbi:MAG: DNA polymerase III subunit [Bacillota bacterium]
MSLSSLVGQPLAKRLFFKTIQCGAVSHGYLFAGPRGSGKLYAARNLAKALNCESPSAEGDACDHCPSCRAIESGVDPAFRVVSGEGPRIKIEQTRALIADLALRPDGGQRKVYVIREADRLTPNAANNLLKVLEEPPSYGVLILTTDNPATLPVTVLSRCQTVPFKPAPLPEVTEAVERLTGASAEQAAQAASMSGGVIGQALELLTSGRLNERLELARSSLIGLGRAGVLERVDFVERMAQYGEDRERLAELLGDMASLYRDALLTAVHPEHRALVGRPDRDLLVGAAADYGVARLTRAVDRVGRAIDGLRRNVQPRLAVEYVVLNV